MSGPTPFLARSSTRWVLRGATLVVGFAALACLSHFLFMEVVPAIDRQEPPAHWGTGIAAFVLLIITMMLSSFGMVAFILARVTAAHAPAPRRPEGPASRSPAPRRPADSAPRPAAPPPSTPPRGDRP